MAGRIQVAARLVSILFIAGCATHEAPAPSATAITILPSQAAALTPSLYLALAANSSLFAIKASELAASRSGDRQLSDAARKVARDQKGVGSQLSYAGRRLDLLPSATLTPDLAADLDQLEHSGDFDRDYRRLVGRALTRALEAHETFARAGSSPTLRPVAQMAAPVTRRNLDAVRRR